MVLKKFTWKSILLGCLRGERSRPEPKQTCSQRLSLSDLSNPVSPISFSDLSISIFNLHVFTLKELQTVTNEFSKSNYLGEGGFGAVYKGFIDDKIRPGLKAQPVAVKVLDLDGSQGHREWLAEIIFLGQLKHRHLVNLIGYCCEEEHRLLVYEYIERGNLENKLFNRLSSNMENVFLFQDYNAKLSDFGLAMDGPEGDDTHVTTPVMGTEGYAAPEYIMTGKILSDLEKKGKESTDECDEIRNGNTCEGKQVEIKEKGCDRHRKGHRHRRRIKSLRSRAVYSDTVLYKTIGTGIKSKPCKRWMGISSSRTSQEYQPLKRFSEEKSSAMNQKLTVIFDRRFHPWKSPSAIITDRTKITERRFLLGERDLYERCLTKCGDGRQGGKEVEETGNNTDVEIQ
ncbi:hypothetical protein D5086_006443 [Populus alba]|uniref:Uncharacterized protein n=1 Tax=Populus alba TaxID=43335 RepID=A0ACC4CL07_POPAL